MSLDDLLAQMRLEYLEVLPQRIETLKKLADAQNWSQIEVEFHKLKGTGKTYGIGAVSELCAALENLAKKQSNAELPQIWLGINGLEKILASELDGQTFDLHNDPGLKVLFEE